MTERTDELASDADNVVVVDPVLVDPVLVDPVLIDTAAADLAAIDDRRRADQDAQQGLPVRSASEVSLSRNIRRMDDPEVLERVLAGLLDLA
jgi:hypothetical protein